MEAHSTNSRFINKYKLDPNFALHIRMISALAFVPSNNVILAFEELLDSPHFFGENEEFLNPLTNYFEDMWIGCRGRKNFGGETRI